MEYLSETIDRRGVLPSEDTSPNNVHAALGFVQGETELRVGSGGAEGEGGGVVRGAIESVEMIEKELREK